MIDFTNTIFLIISIHTHTHTRARIYIYIFFLIKIFVLFIKWNTFSIKTNLEWNSFSIKTSSNYFFKKAGQKIEIYWVQSFSLRSVCGRDSRQTQFGANVPLQEWPWQPANTTKLLRRII